MKCQKCGCANTKVIDSRITSNSRRRRRECAECSIRFTTTEMYGIHKVNSLPLFIVDVLKRDDELELYNEAKLAASIRHVCSRRSVSTDTLDILIAILNDKISGELTSPVSVKDIVDLVTAELVQHDKISALRYAVQYIDFKGPDQYLKYVAKLTK